MLTLRRLIALLLMLCSTLAVQAQTVTVILPETVNPDGTIQPTSPWLVKLLDALSAASQLTLEPRTYPWKRAQIYARQGKGLIWGVAKTTERTAYLRFSEPVFHIHTWAISRKTDNFYYRNLGSLDGKVVGIVDGVHYTDAFEAARGKRFHIEEDRNVMEARVGKLLNHRIDVLLEAHFTDDPGRMLATLGRNNPKFDPDALALQRLPDLGHSVHFAIARSHPDQKLLAQVNKGLQQLRRTGELDRILATR